MSTPQRIVLLAGLVIVVLLLLFPPRYHVGEGIDGERRYNRGFRYLGVPDRAPNRIDYVMWLWPIGAVALMAALAWLELRRNGGG